MWGVSRLVAFQGCGWVKDEFSLMKMKGEKGRETENVVQHMKPDHKSCKYKTLRRITPCIVLQEYLHRHYRNDSVPLSNEIELSRKVPSIVHMHGNYQTRE